MGIIRLVNLLCVSDCSGGLPTSRFPNREIVVTAQEFLQGLIDREAGSS